MATPSELTPAAAEVAPARAPDRPGARRRLALRDRLLVGFVLAHVPLAVAMQAIPGVATLHALASVLAGISFATAGRHPARVAYAVFYLAGAEVLWRMTRAGVVWEYGKYSTVVILLLAGIRLKALRNSSLALVYFGLLVPSIPLTFMEQEFGLARMYVSFNMSGPLALAAACWFAAHLRLTREEVDRLLLAFVAPVLGIAALAALGIATAGNIEWVAESNFKASGGFGPNQVSSIMGLGIVVAFLVIGNGTAPRAVRLLMFPIIVILGVQSALTFSRSGLYLAISASLAAGIFFLTRRQGRLRIVLAVIALASLGRYVLAPELDTFTGGKLSERFTEGDLTGRDDILSADLEIFLSNPVLGIGPGMGPVSRDQRGKKIAAHTEYSRMLAEHGLLGATALLLLVLMGVNGLRRRRVPWERAVTAGLLAWAMLFMLSNGMRVVAPGLLFGFACFLTFAATPRPSPPPATAPATPTRSSP